ncbi:MAG: hypothetical protein WDM80_13085 [Limisphaerales bacterium]
MKARQTAQSNACLNNLRIIDAAKQQWAWKKVSCPPSPRPAVTSRLTSAGWHDHADLSHRSSTYVIAAVRRAPTCPNSTASTARTS